MSYIHREAFCLMKYAAEDGSEVEWIWNSRDGVTPFCVANRAGTKMMQHVDWHLDRRIPNYQPCLGERIFVSLTQERALQRATAKVEFWWEHPEHPLKDKFATKEVAIASFLAYFEVGIAPELVEAGTLQPVNIVENPPFRVKVWCQFCCGEDFDGCFEGRTEILKEQEFDTIDSAIIAGLTWRPGDSHPWTFTVIDSTGEDVRSDCRDGWLHPWNNEANSVLGEH